jgi:hypothetical protein
MKYKDDYADEFDIEGFCLVEDDVVEDFKRFLGDYQYDFFYVFQFGTNEEIEYESIEQLLSCLTFSGINQSTKSTIWVEFGMEFGICPRIIDIVHQVIGYNEPEEEYSSQEYQEICAKYPAIFR